MVSSHMKISEWNQTIRETTMENKYKKGEIVFERVRPTQKLIVSRYSEGIYYCKDHEFQMRKELVYTERELALAQLFSPKNLR